MIRPVTGLAASIRARLSADRGVTLALTAGAMLMTVAVSAIVIDLGNAWRHRRALIPATDAAALAAAHDFVDGDNGCAGTAADYLTLNDPDATLTGCESEIYTDEWGRVTVSATNSAETWFASAIGFGDVDVVSTSTAAWGPPASAYGLRPMALCLDGSDELANVVNDPPEHEVIIRIDYDKDQPSDCGGTSIPGNWGIIDFDGGANSNADTKEWVENGYPGQVYFDLHNVTTCVGEEHCYEGDTGALSGLNSELNTLQSSGDYFTLPLFNFVENPGGNARFHLVGIIRVRLIDYKVNGAEATRFFEFGVLPGLVAGTCCDGGGATSGTQVYSICGVEPGAYEACEP